MHCRLRFNIHQVVSTHAAESRGTGFATRNSKKVMFKNSKPLQPRLRVACNNSHIFASGKIVVSLLIKRTLNFNALDDFYSHLSVLTLGGSVVILIPDWRIEIGKSGCGLLLSHSLKSLCGFSICSCSTSLSNWGIQLNERWQLAKNTQFP